MARARNQPLCARVEPPKLPAGSQLVGIGTHFAEASAVPPLARYLPKRLSCFHLSPRRDVVKEAFRRALVAAMGRRELVSLPCGISEDETFHVANCIYHDVPEAIFVKKASLVTSGEHRQIRFDFDGSEAEAEQVLASMQATARPVVQRACSEPGALARVKLLHDWLVERCIYSDEEPRHAYSASGPLVHGKGVCLGMAKGFKYLCDRTGVPCMVVAGYFEPEPDEVPLTPFSGNHAWNIVFVDRAWFHIDVTHDLCATKGGKSCNGQNGAPPRYDYFLLSDRQMRADRAFASKGLPPCPRGWR